MSRIEQLNKELIKVKKEINLFEIMAPKNDKGDIVEEHKRQRLYTKLRALEDQMHNRLSYTGDYLLKKYAV